MNTTTDSVKDSADGERSSSSGAEVLAAVGHTGTDCSSPGSENGGNQTEQDEDDDINGST